MNMSYFYFNITHVFYTSKINRGIKLISYLKQQFAFLEIENTFDYVTSIFKLLIYIK